MIDNVQTSFLLRMTMAQKDLLLRMARLDRVDIDKPEALNAWILRNLGVDI